jgi:hypothetical protein
MIQVN